MENQPMAQIAATAAEKMTPWIASAFMAKSIGDVYVATQTKEEATAKLEARLAGLEQKMTESEEKRSGLEQERKENEKLKDRIGELEIELAKQEVHYKAAKKETAALKAINTREMKDKRREVTKLEEAIKSNRSLRLETKKELQACQEQLKIQEASVSKLVAEKASLEAQVEDHVRKARTHAALSAINAKTAEKTMAQLSSKIEEHETMVKASANAAEHLKKLSGQLEDSRKLLQIAEERKKSLGEDLAQQKVAEKRLKEDIESHMGKITDVKEKLKASEFTVESLRKEKVQLEAQLTAEKEEVLRIQVLHSSAIEQEGHHRKQLAEATQTISELEKLHKDERREYEKLQQETKRLNEELGGAKARVNELQGQLNTSATEKDPLLVKELAEKQKTVKDLEDMLKSSQKQNQEMRENFERSSEALKQEKAVVAELTSKLNLREKEVGQLQEEKARLTEELTSQRGLVATIKTKLDQTKKDNVKLREEKDPLEESLRIRQRRVVELESKLASVEPLNQALQKEVDQLAESLEEERNRAPSGGTKEIEAALRGDVQKLNEEKSDLTIELGKLQDVIARQQEASENAQKQAVDELTQQLKASKHEANVVRDELNNMTESLMNANRDIEWRKTEMSRAEEKYKDVQEKAAKASQETADALHFQAEAAAREEEMRKQTENAQKDLANAMQQISVLMNEKASQDQAFIAQQTAAQEVAHLREQEKQMYMNAMAENETLKRQLQKSNNNAAANQQFSFAAGDQSTLFSANPGQAFAGGQQVDMVQQMHDNNEQFGPKLQNLSARVEQDGSAIENNLARLDALLAKSAAKVDPPQDTEMEDAEASRPDFDTAKSSEALQPTKDANNQSTAMKTPEVQPPNSNVQNAATTPANDGDVDMSDNDKAVPTTNADPVRVNEDHSQTTAKPAYDPEVVFTQSWADARKKAYRLNPKAYYVCNNCSFPAESDERRDHINVCNKNKDYRNRCKALYVVRPPTEPLAMRNAKAAPNPKSQPSSLRTPARVTTSSSTPFPVATGSTIPGLNNHPPSEPSKFFGSLVKKPETSSPSKTTNEDDEYPIELDADWVPPSPSKPPRKKAVPKRRLAQVTPTVSNVPNFDFDAPPTSSNEPPAGWQLPPPPPQIDLDQRPGPGETKIQQLTKLRNAFISHRFETARGSRSANPELARQVQDVVQQYKWWIDEIDHKIKSLENKDRKQNDLTSLLGCQHELRVKSVAAEAKYQEVFSSGTTEEVEAAEATMRAIDQELRELDARIIAVQDKIKRAEVFPKLKKVVEEVKALWGVKQTCAEIHVDCLEDMNPGSEALADAKNDLAEVNAKCVEVDAALDALEDMTWGQMVEMLKDYEAQLEILRKEDEQGLEEL